MSGATTVPLNTFVHVAVTFESSSRALILYINGTQVASATSLFSTIFDNTEPLLIGAGDLGSNVRDFFNGIVDEVEVHSRALSQSELASIVAAGNDGKCLGTAGERRAQVNVGGAVGAIAAAAGQQASENRQRAAAAAVASQPVVQAPSTGTGVTPPNTGDGGLLAPTGKRHDAYWFTLAATIFGLALVSWRVVRGT
jgi:hypothetical protein